MSRLILKFGGSSVATLDKIKHAAKIVMEHAQGAQVIVVVSAMQGETNRLLELAKKTHNPLVPNREFDQLLATGETVSASLMALALESYGLNARSMTGSQAGIYTDNMYQDASIQSVDTNHLNQLIEQEIIPVVTGFQGIYCDDTTTLGRGGSDLTAIALAKALDADNCWIYTDVKGVYAVDPNTVSNEDIFEQIGYEILKKMALSGAEVIQYAAIDYAQTYKVPVRICSTFEPGIGTLVNNIESFDRPIIVKHTGLTKLNYDAAKKEAYFKLFGKKVVYSNEVCHLLSMVVPEIKTKLKLLNDMNIADNIMPNQTLISIFMPNNELLQTLYDFIETFSYAAVLSSSSEKDILRVLVPDYKMTPLMTEIYQHSKQLSKDKVCG